MNRFFRFRTFKIIEIIVIQSVSRRNKNQVWHMHVLKLETVENYFFISLKLETEKDL